MAIAIETKMSSNSHDYKKKQNKYEISQSILFLLNHFFCLNLKIRLLKSGIGFSLLKEPMKKTNPMEMHPQ